MRETANSEAKYSLETFNEISILVQLTHILAMLKGKAYGLNMMYNCNCLDYSKILNVFIYQESAS